MTKYDVVIGLEIHCEMKSNTKVYSPAPNSYSDTPNSHVYMIDMAFPGILPVVNKYCVHNAIKMATILNCTIPEYMEFDRKNYYYPDLPKGYQITQFNNPVGTNGYLEYEVNGEMKKALVHEIHLEEDSASLDHFSDTSTIDYNRAGVPLLELVTEPCFHNTEEVLAFLETVKNIYQYSGISDADSKKGQIRYEVNISIKDPGSDILGTKVEIKNINSFSNVAATIAYEIKRQSDLKDQGNYDQVEQETRRYDEETDRTIRMRSKADAIDYKYFVEPNIPRYHITREWIEEIKKEIPLLPNERKKKYINELELSEYDTNIILKDIKYANFFEELVNLGVDAKTAANWLTVNILGYLNKEGISFNELFITPKMLKFILDNLANGTISSKQAKEVFNKVLVEEKDPSNFISKDNAQISDKTELLDIITEIISNNQDNVTAYKNGKTNLFEFFVGNVMKQTRGKANPELTRELLKKELEK